MLSDSVKIYKRDWVRRGFFHVLRTLYSHRRFDGIWSEELDREIIHRGNIVAVLPYDPLADKYVLIKQFRIGAYWAPARNEKKPRDGVIWETVSGYVDKDESIEEAAEREIKNSAASEPSFKTTRAVSTDLLSSHIL